MALPKEPRQKMINFMYLVLTAMLALNVSTEILNAFKVVDISLLNSNGVIKTSNETITGSLAEQGKKPELAAKVAIWKPRADEAIAATTAMSKYIDDLKLKLKQEAGLVIKEDGKEDFKEDDLDAATRLMIDKTEGPKLQDELQKFITKISEIIPDSARKKLPKFPLDLTPIKSNNEASQGDWTYGYFHMTPSVAGLTMLSKFQNDVMRSGNIVANFCQEQIGKVEVVLDKFEILTSQNTNYILPGQQLEIKAGIGAFSSAAKPTITINGQSQIANDSGFARVTTSPSSSGSVPVIVSFKDPNTGNIVEKRTQVSYTVGQASGASIFLKKMNVMYIGVDNPLSISAGSAKRAGMSVSMSGGTISAAGGGDDFVARVTAQGPQTVTVSAEGKSFTFPIRVKRLPDPAAFVGTYRGGVIPTAVFKVQGGVRAQLVDSDFEAPFQILGYTIGGYVNGSYQEINVNGNAWGSNPIITSAKPNNLISIFNIRSQGPDGVPRKLAELTFKLQ